MTHPDSTSLGAPSLRHSYAFSLLEVLMTLTGVGILSAITIAYVSSTPESVALAKLESDVRKINNAVQVYAAFGGSLAGADSAEDVITRLQTKADTITAKQTAGLTGSFVDPSLRLEMQSSTEATSDQPRAIWDSASGRFVIAHGGSAGVKRFTVNGNATPATLTSESRNPSMRLSAVSTWIWDYRESRATGGMNPTGIDVDNVVYTPMTAGPPPAGSPQTLKKPLFSIPQGNYPISDFNLNLYLANPNLAGVSRIKYRVDSGAWMIYAGGPISMYPNSKISAFAETTSSNWKNSSKANSDYKPDPAKLKAPLIATTAPQFDYVENAVIDVRLESLNHPDTEQLEYRLNGGAWLEYTGPFPVYALNYESTGVDIEARAISAAEYYLDSDSTFGRIEPPAVLFSITGESNGEFYDPIGGNNLVTNLTAGVSDEYFTWGTATGTDVASWLEFTGAAYSDVRPGERFMIGAFDYYNGTIASGTGAESINFSIDLEFSGSETRTFDFELGMINTPNNDVSPWEAADFVFVDSVFASTNATIAGQEFTLQIEFGETGVDGFSTIDQFHVLEDASAFGNLYATLFPVFDVID